MVAPRDTLIALEATSTYWVALAVTLHTQGYHVCVVNPTHVHHHAQSMTRRSKTDNSDAILLADFAREKYRRLHDWTPLPQVYHELRQRLVARDGLLTMRTQTSNHMHAPDQWPVQITSVREHLQTVLATLDEQIAALERELKVVLRDGAWAKSAAHYAGLAPMERQSGTSIRGRASIGHAGDGRIRTALFMATMSAATHKVMIKTFPKRLKAAGKADKVVRIACARKLMHLCYAVIINTVSTTYAAYFG